MIMQMPREMATTRMATAMLCSCTISFHKWYGVSLSITRNAMMKMSIPINAKTRALTMLPSGTRFILFASGVMVIEAVNRTVGPRIIADGLRNVLELIDGVEAPSAVLAESGGADSREPVKKIEFSEHYSASTELCAALERAMGG